MPATARAPKLDRSKPKLLVRDLSLIAIAHGSHGDRSNGLCVMEVAAWFAGQPHSDHPPCVCPVIGQFLRSWNDSLPDDDSRSRLLRPLVKKIVGTKATPEIELARAMLCVDWSCRVWLPAFFALTPALAPHAATLRSAKPIQRWEDFDKIAEPLRAAQKDANAASDAAWYAARDAARAAAWDAASDAARDAAWAAAWDAARDAARDAAWAAARAAARAAASDAAWYAARAAARDAAWAAARAAAWDAAKKKLAPTVSDLQDSAVALVERMCALK